ncbi:MAG: hypothetical protein LKI59_00210 [Bacteroidales bacterium]|jgi:hypothetical protein|nr:hypothetical protein [Bacteroidales bacterium]
MSRRIADLLIKIGADSYEFQQKAAQVEKGLGGLEKKLTSVGKSLSLKLTAPLAALGALSLSNADTQAKAEAKVQQAIKSTSGAAKLSFSQLKEYASELQSKTLFGDETILNNATAQLLTFTNIAGENFKRTQAVALDLATVLDGDLKSASLQLGKALNDPVKNLSALSRSGIQFSEEQKSVINHLAKTNRLAEAQGVILKELERQYGGQAQAAAKVGLGAAQQLKNAWGDFLEQIGAALMPMVNKLAQALTGVVNALQAMSPTMHTVLVTTATLAASIGPVSLAIGSIIKMMPMLAAGVTALMSPIGAVAAAVLALGAAFIYAKKRKAELFEEKVSGYENLSMRTLENNLHENRRQQEVNQNESPWQGQSPYSKLNYALDKPKRTRQLKEEEAALLEAINRRKKALEEAKKIESEQLAVEQQLTEAMGLSTLSTNESSSAAENQGGITNELTAKIAELEKKKLLPQTSLEQIAQYNDEISRLKDELQRVQNITSKDLIPREALQPLATLTAIKAPELTIEPPKLGSVVSTYQKQMQEVFSTVRDGMFGWADSTSEYMKENLGDTVAIVQNYTKALTDKGYSFSAALEHVSQTVKDTMDRFDQQVSQFLADSITAAAKSLGQLMAGELGFEGLMKSILTQFASFLKNIGAQLIEFGVMMIAFKTALKSVLANPWAAIGVGAAMVAAAAIMTALINKKAQDNAPALASGGLAYGKTLAVIGDNTNASIDPEVIAPLSKLQSMLPESGGGAQSISITLGGELKAKGRDLVYALNQESFKTSVLGG